MDAPDAPVSGPVASAVLRTLDELGETESALGQVALTLAKALDDGAGMATAAVSKELRATLADLSPKESDEPSDALSRLLTGLSSPLRN